MTTTSNDSWDLTLEEEDRVAEFFDAGQWIVAPGRENEEAIACYYWEDFQKALKFHEENPDTFIYTIIECDEGAYIIQGACYVNRFAYLIGLDDVSTGKEDEVRLW